MRVASATAGEAGRGAERRAVGTEGSVNMEGGAGRGEGEAASQGTGVEGVLLYSNLYQPTWIFRMCDAQWCRLKGTEPLALVSKSSSFLLLFHLTRNNETLSPKWGLPVLKYWPEMTNPRALFKKGCNYSQVASHSFVGSFSLFSSFFSSEIWIIGTITLHFHPSSWIYSVCLDSFWNTLSNVINYFIQRITAISHLQLNPALSRSQ